MNVLNGINILITAGATRENIDPVRFISNYSSGKMGFALADVAIDLGATVTLIAGHHNAVLRNQNITIINVSDTQQMLQNILSVIETQHIFISCAAVSDYVIKHQFVHKIKKHVGNLVLELEPNIDILNTISHKYNHLFIVGFAAETENLLSNAHKKLINKKLDMVIANDVSNADSGFNSEFNHVFAISNNNIVELKKDTKLIISRQLLELIYNQYMQKLRQDN